MVNYTIYISEMINIFECTTYREYLKRHIKDLPKAGRGFRLALAKELGVHTSLITQILKEEKDFTLEQAVVLAKWLGLRPLETNYFFNLVLKSRAGTSDLRAMAQVQLDKIKEQAEKLSNRLPPDQRLSEEAIAEFYSSWYYSAIRLSTSLKNQQTPEAISQALDLPLAHVRAVLEFLVTHGLVEQKHGLFQVGPAQTHLPSDSAHIHRHHTNWRLKALERLHPLERHEMMFTSPLTISAEHRIQVRQHLVKAIDEVTNTVTKSGSEVLCCLNIDWFDAGARGP
jgi:uncharacterized protein (TIGR02147 family)